MPYPNDSVDAKRYKPLAKGGLVQKPRNVRKYAVTVILTTPEHIQPSDMAEIMKRLVNGTNGELSRSVVSDNDIRAESATGVKI